MKHRDVMNQELNLKGWKYKPKKKNYYKILNKHLFSINKSSTKTKTQNHYFLQHNHILKKETWHASIVE